MICRPDECGANDASTGGGVKIDVSAQLMLSNEVKARSLLRDYQNAQDIYRIEGMGPKMSFGTLAELNKNKLIKAELFNACDRLAKPQLFSGHLFAEIEKDEAGAPLNREKRAGLCAYPASPGKTGGVITLILCDDQAKDGWDFYVAPYKDIGRPVRSWPTAEELKKYTKLGKMTAGQARHKVDEINRHNISK